MILSDGSRYLAVYGKGIWNVRTNPNKLNTIERYGNQLLLKFNNNAVRALAFKSTNLWYVGANPEPLPRFIWPFPPDPVADPDDEFGPRPPLPFHNGKDFSGLVGASYGAPIIAMGDGQVIISQIWNGDTDPSSLQSLGNYVRLSHGGGLLTGYAHMNDTPLVNFGDSVVQGQTLGYVGDTGYTFGAHLHLETWEDGVRINPRDWMSAYAI